MFRRNNNNNINDKNSFNNGHIVVDGGDGNDMKSSISSSSAISIGNSSEPPIHPRGTNPILQMSTGNMNNHNHNNGSSSSSNPSIKKLSTKNRSTANLSTSLSSFFSPISFIIIIGILLYIIFIQYSIIRTKDAAILTILTHPYPTQQQQQPQSSSTLGTLLLKSRHLFNNKQYKLFEIFHKQCSSTGTVSNIAVTGGDSIRISSSSGVGIFPIRKPSTDMDTLIKIQQRAQIPWKPYTSTILSKISYPIFVPSLPKSGTTSIWKYFKCGYQEACHNWIQGSKRGEKSSLLGICVEKNIRNAVTPFENCGPYDVYTDSGVSDFKVVILRRSIPALTDSQIFPLPIYASIYFLHLVFEL
jgi:hypothetical protein